MTKLVAIWQYFFGAYPGSSRHRFVLSSLSNRKLLAVLSFLLCLLNLLPTLLHAQQERLDSVLIPPVTITDDSYPMYNDFFNQNDSTLLFRSLYADAGILLNKKSPIHLRNYGPGLIYSFSVRGGNSAQTAVLWNGIPINSAMQGQTDLSLIKPGRSERLLFSPNNFQHGLAGSLEISNQDIIKDHVTLALNQGFTSLLGYNSQANFSYNKGGYSGRIEVIQGMSHNNYSYLIDGENREQTNNQLNNWQLKGQFGKQWSQGHSLQFNGWIISSKREIPPAVYEKQSDAFQEDHSLKLMGRYRFTKPAWSLKLNTALTRDDLYYSSQIKQILSDSRALQLFQQFSLEHQNKLGVFYQLKVQNKWMQVSSNSYSAEKVSKNDLTLHFSGQRLWRNKHLILLGFKSGTYDGTYAPFSPFGKYTYRYSPQLKFLISAGRKYRYPGFNDYFWAIGGNQELLPEIAWETEVGLWTKRNDQWKAEIRGYLKQVRNWIIWLPENGIFRASNLDQVAGQGLESSLHYSLSKSYFSLQASLFYNWNQTKRVGMDQSGKQLIYTPRQLIKQNIQLTQNTWSLFVDQSWTGKVYTTSDHSESIKGYYLLDMHIEKDFKWGEHRFAALFSIENLLNEQYQSIKNYAMPGRIFRLGFGWKAEKSLFHLNNKK